MWNEAQKKKLWKVYVRRGQIDFPIMEITDTIEELRAAFPNLVVCVAEESETEGYAVLRRLFANEEQDEGKPAGVGDRVLLKCVGVVSRELRQNGTFDVYFPEINERLTVKPEHLERLFPDGEIVLCDRCRWNYGKEGEYACGHPDGNAVGRVGSHYCDAYVRYNNWR